MPLTAQQLTVAHRRQQLALRDITLADIRRLWPELSWEDLDGTYPALAAAIAEVVAQRRRTSAGLSVAYLRAHRVASGLNGDVRIVIPQPLNLDQFDSTLHPLSVAAVKTSTAKSVDRDEAMSNALTRASGAMARLVLDAGRRAVLDTMRGDTKTVGYRRIVGSGACDFCRTVGGSGSRIYKVDADFDVHSKCGCTSEPVYRA
jgi:hypothetical protein